MDPLTFNTPARLSFDEGTLVLTDIDRGQMAGLFAPGFWAWDGRVGAWRCDAIHYAAVREILRSRLGTRFRDDLPLAPRIVWPEVNLPPLRPEQREALAAWRAAGRGQVIMPTGTGKTVVALAAMAETRVSTLVVAPVRDLMYQWHRRIRQGLGYDAGILGDSLMNLKPVTVTTYDSAYIHMGRIGADFGLVVFDEEHHLPGPCRREAALLSAAPMRLGLTATPERTDGLDADLAWLVGPVVYRQEIAHAKGKTLAEYDVVRIPVALGEEEQSRYEAAGRAVRQFIIEKHEEHKDYDWRDLCADAGKDPAARRAQKAYYIRKSIEDRAVEKLRVLEDIFRLHPGERVIIFAGSNAMARDVSCRFLVPTLLNHSRKRERQTVLDGFSAGTFPVIVANQVLDEGVDVPEAKVAVVIGGHASTRQAKQRLGRILRKTGGARAVLYEIVCQDTRDELRSRQRRKTDAYSRTRHRRL
ncbi:MAG: DEAD/DEAH box helicase family protein [Pirellulales bacterium]